MKTICIMNLKGGVGKTVTAGNFADVLAADHGRRALLIDADHQGNTSRFFRADQEAAALRDVLTSDNISYWIESVQQTDHDGSSIIPADMSLAELDAATGGYRFSKDGAGIDAECTGWWPVPEKT